MGGGSLATGRRAAGRRIGGWVGLAAVLAAPAALAAQAGPTGSASEPRTGCFRGQPLPACRTFWIVEIQGSVPLAQSQREVRRGGQVEPVRDATESVLEWNVGHMVNVAGSWAVGGVLTVGSGNDDPLTGIKARGRRWLTPDLSLELETGVARSNAGSSRFPGVSGWTSDVRVNIRDQGSFYVRWDVLSLPEQRFPGLDYLDPGGTHHGVSIGASAGSVPALIATAALGVTYAVLLGVLLGDS